MSTNETFVATQKASLDAFFGLAHSAFEGVEKLAELNLQVAKTTLGEAAETSQSMLAMKDPKELVALQTALMKSLPEKVSGYSRHVYDIVSATAEEVRKATEATAADSQKKFVAAVDAAMKNAPAGSENAVALVKSAMAAATSAYENAQKAATQAAAVAESNVKAVVATAKKAIAAAPSA